MVWSSSPSRCGRRTTSSRTPAHPRPHHRRSSAQQWSWTFNYDNGPVASTTPTTTSVYDAGDTGSLSRPVPAGRRDGPVQPALARRHPRLRVPAFLFKHGRHPRAARTTSASHRPGGHLQGRCAELCGVYHSRMLFNVKVVSRDDYAAHLQDLEDQGNTGRRCSAGRSQHRGRARRPPRRIPNEKPQLTAPPRRSRAPSPAPARAGPADRQGPHHHRPQGDRQPLPQDVVLLVPRRPA